MSLVMTPYTDKFASLGSLPLLPRLYLRRRRQHRGSNLRDGLLLWCLGRTRVSEQTGLRVRNELELRRLGEMQLDTTSKNLVNNTP